MKLKAIQLLLLSTAVVLLVACGGGAAAPSVDIEATVESRVKERLAAIPTPTARIVVKEVVKEVVVEKEVPVEKIVTVVVTATPTPIPTPTATNTPTPEPATGQVQVRYYDAVENSIYVEVLEALAEDQYLEFYADIVTNFFLLPEDLLLSMGECSVANAYYLPDFNQVVVCIEFLLYAAEVLAPFATDEPELVAWTEGMLAYIMWHEMGHALIEIMGLPTVGREEDAVDQLAALILIESEGGLEALDAVIGFYYIGGSNAAAMGQLAFWDEHSLDIVRAYDMACLMYGADPIYAADYVELGFLPQERAQRCGEEYAKIDTAWATLLGPYLK